MIVGRSSAIGMRRPPFESSMLFDTSIRLLRVE